MIEYKKIVVPIGIFSDHTCRVCDYVPYKGVIFQEYVPYAAWNGFWEVAFAAGSMEFRRVAGI